MDFVYALIVIGGTALVVFLGVRWARARGSKSQGTSIAGNIMKLYNEMYAPSAAKSIEERVAQAEAPAPKHNHK